MTEFPDKLRWFSGLIFGAALAGALGLAALGDVPPWTPVAIFGALIFFGEHRAAVTLPVSGFLITPSFMVYMAAIVVFRADNSVLGPVLVGMVAGVYVPHVRNRQLGWVAFNSGVTGVALLLAALSFQIVPTGMGMPQAVVGVIPPALVYALVSTSLIAISYELEGRGRVRAMFEAGPVLLQPLLFALVGFFLGRLYLDLGPAIVLLIIVPILIAREVFSSYLSVKESHEETVQMLIRALEAKDRYTAGHAGRVAKYAQYMGEELGFMPARLERLRFAALMHDIGKLVVPNHLLNKPGKLTAEEYARVRIHEQVSIDMLSRIDFLAPIAPSAHSDHTRFDPDDPNHPIEPYIVMIADAYDAMTSTRAYRKALPQEVAFEELRSKAGTQFHPYCVEALIRAIEKRGEHHGAGYEDGGMEYHPEAPEAGLGSAGLGDLLASSEGAA